MDGNKNSISFDLPLVKITNTTIRLSAELNAHGGDGSPRVFETNNETSAIPTPATTTTLRPSFNSLTPALPTFKSSFSATLSKTLHRTNSGGNNNPSTTLRRGGGGGAAAASGVDSATQVQVPLDDALATLYEYGVLPVSPSPHSVVICCYCLESLGGALSGSLTLRTTMLKGTCTHQHLYHKKCFEGNASICLYCGVKRKMGNEGE